MPKGVRTIEFTHKGEKVSLDVTVSGRPRAGESTDEAVARKVAEAKKIYRASQR